MSPKSWEVTEKGFWRGGPYLALSESFFYEDEKVILNQHIIVEEGKTDIYRFWTHFFSHNDLIEILSPFQYNEISFHEDVLADGDLWNGDNVTFCIAVK